MNYSIIVPVYNRPDEVDELLESLTHQVFRNFEVIIVEDGSDKRCDEVCNRYKDLLPLRYYYKKNSGPGNSRNFGVDYANGDYVIILDSDVVVPPHYLSAIDEELSREQCDFFGGADAAHASFTPVQKAISYSMTSFFTTGGIRGGKKKLDKFYPRSYNMGVRRTAYQALGGFSRMRFGEDIDFSYRLIENGYKSRLFPEAWVWHKRRTDLRKFFRQVYNSGIARINLEKRHPGTMKPVHLLPMLFTLGVLLLLLLSPWCLWTLTPLLAYALIICIHSSVVNKSLRVGLLSVPAAFTQLTGYGLGFINAWWKRCMLRQDEFQAFEKTFYK
ncbi:MAG: glycosyltransferase [Prevotella sp.]|nr:glycosyltransferase [Prevotella sp.]